MRCDRILLCLSALGFAAPTVAHAISPGQTHTQMDGCLKGGAATRSAPARGPTRPSKVTITPVAGGVQIVHDFSHACCLKGQVRTRTSGHTLTVHEVLSGTPCRCICSSTITTTRGLKPGAWSVRVFQGSKLAYDGHTRVGGGSGVDNCKRSGCSGQVCADRNVITTCEFRPEYGCYRQAECKRQANGQCGFTNTAALRSCLQRGGQ